MEGLVASLAVGEGQVWALTEDGALWARAGLGPGTPMGTNWFRLQVSRNDGDDDSDEMFRTVMTSAGGWWTPWAPR